MAAIQTQNSFEKGWVDADFVKWLEKELAFDSQETHDSYSVVSLAFSDDHDALEAYISLLNRFCAVSSSPIARTDEATRWSQGGDLRDALASLRKSPRMHVRSNALCHVRAWIDGFLYAHSVNGVAAAGASDFAKLCGSILKQAMLPGRFEWDRAIAYNWTDDGPALERFFVFCDETGFFGTAKGSGL